MPQFRPYMAQRIDLDGLGGFIATLAKAAMPLFPDEQLQEYIAGAAGPPEPAHYGPADPPTPNARDRIAGHLGHDACNSRILLDLNLAHKTMKSQTVVKQTGTGHGDQLAGPFIVTVFDKSQLPKFVHEMAYAGPRSANHVRKRLLTNFSYDRLWRSFLAKVCHQEKEPRQTFLARIEK